MPPTSLPIACSFLEVSCHVDAHSQSLSATTVSHSVAMRFFFLKKKVFCGFGQGDSSIRVPLYWFRHLT